MSILANSFYLDNLLASPSSPETLLGWLSKGLGRAILHLQKHDPKPYLPVLEQACVKSLIYDAQLEPSRAPYLLKMIEFSQNSEYLINAIVSAYKSGNGDNRDRWQLSALMTQLAASGNQAAKQILFEIASSVESVSSNRRYADADDLLTADFDLAIIHLHNEYARLTSDEDKSEWLGEFIFHIEYSSRKKLLSDEQTVGKIIGDSDSDKSLVRSVFQKREVERLEGRSRAKRPIPTYDEVSRQIRDTGVRRGLFYYGRAKWMPKEDLRRLAEDFREETDPIIIPRYIGAFIWTRCPIGFRRILKFTDTSVKSSPREIGGAQDVAINALSQFRHKTIRNLAHKMADQGDIWAATMLIERNLSKEELPFINKLCSPETPMSDDDRHSVAMLVRHIAKNMYDADILPLILSVYESSPCSTCRESTADALLEHDAVPDWVRIEAVFDANVSIAKSLGVKSDIAEKPVETHSSSS